jgi:predicted anti-sigma-YlaC factor YlaD
MTMLTRAECEAVVRQLWPFVDGYLGEENRERILRHLERCDSCRSHFDFAAEFLAAVAAVAPARSADLSSLERRVVRALTAAG